MIYNVYSYTIYWSNTTRDGIVTYRSISGEVIRTTIPAYDIFNPNDPSEPIGTKRIIVAVEDSIFVSDDSFALIIQGEFAGTWDDGGSGDPPSFPPIETSVVKTNCSRFDFSDGTINLSVTGGSGLFTYAWSNGQTTQDLNFLAAGIYTVTITDTTTGLTKVVAVEITSPTQLTASFVKTNCTANGANDGTITVTPLGGSGSVAFLWNDSSTAQNRSGLSPATYSVQITDLITGEVITLVNIIITEPAIVPPDEGGGETPGEVLGSYFQVPFLNSLRFVIQDNRPQTPDNRLLCDQYFPGFKKTSYLQKVEKADSMKIQFHSNYNSHVVQMFNALTDAFVQSFTVQLKEQNVDKASSFNVTIRNHTVVGNSRVYFNGETAIPIPLQVGDAFKITNNTDGFNGDYSVLSIGFDSALNQDYLVITKNYTIPTTNTQGTAEFTVSNLDYNVYESTLDLSAVADGKYYFKILAISDNSAEAISEPIDLKVEHPKTYLINYSNLDNAYGVTWTTGIKFNLRVEAMLFKRLPTGERTISRDADFTPVKVSSRRMRNFLFEVYMLPPYLHEKLAVIFDLDNWFINGVKYQATEGYDEPSYIDRFMLANSSIKVEQVGWLGNYNSDDITSVEDGGYIATETGFLKR